MEVIYDAVALEAGAKVYLPPETYLTLKSTTVRRVVSKTLSQSSRAEAYTSQSFQRGRIASTYEAARHVPGTPRFLFSIEPS